jgi:replicative DNA helicase Mcm
MVKLRWLKEWKTRNVGDISNVAEKSAENFVSQGYAEYVETEQKNTQKTTPISSGKLKESSKVNSDVTSVTSDTSIQSVTSDTGSTCNTFDPVTPPLDSIFQTNTIDSVLRWFLVNKNPLVTFAELATNLGKKKESVRAVINRYKQFFSVTGSKGSTQVLQVGKLGIEEINRRSAIYLENQEKLKVAEERKKEQKRAEESYDSEVASFLVENRLEREGNSVTIDFSDILEHSTGLADLFLENPTRFIDRVKDYFQTEINVTITNLPKKNCISIEQIRKDHLDKVISIDGRITSFGEVKPIVLENRYECPSCGTLLTVKQNYRIGLIQEPIKCGCGRRGAFREIDREETNACFIQLEDLQDRTDNPHSQRIKAVLFDGLCDDPKIKIFSPGNEVRCTGIIKRVPIFKGGKETTFNNLIFEIMSAELLEREIEITQISDEDILKIEELSNKIDKEGLQPLVSSFAPDIYGYDSIKGALCLQACNKRNEKKVKTVRNKSNVLLIGDPGVAKSVMCDFALDITNGRKAVGGGSSAVGITASVVKEEDSLGGYRVEPGAMILAKDLLFLDEMNNLSDEDKPKLQEGMNEQTVSINKANLHVQMKVTCGIVAVANPKDGHFTEDEDLAKQFNIPTPILNRFDAIFVVRDNISETNDRLIAEKMIRRHRGKIKPEYDKKFLKLFFTYIKQLEEPEINDDIEKVLQTIYAEARKTTESNVKINPRFLESLTRLSTSVAKLRQSKFVEKKDLQIALEILAESQYKINPYIITNLL